MTPEQLAQIAAILGQVAPDPAVAAARNHLLAVRDGLLKSLNAVNDALAAMDGGAAVQPSVPPSVPVEIPIPPSLDPAPEPEKASKWGKLKSVFRKVWPVAAVAAAFIPGAPLVVGAVNAVLNTTVDPATVAGGAAGVTALITAGVSEYRKQAAAEKPKE